VIAVDEECLVRSRLSGAKEGTYFDDFDQLVDVVCLDAVPTLGDDDTFAFA